MTATQTTTTTTLQARATPPPLSPAQLKQGIEQGIAFVARSGLVLETLTPGHVAVRMPLKGNQNHIGTLYAGALFTAAEIPGGALFLAGFDPVGCYPVVKELNLKFLKPATTDTTATCHWPEPERGAGQGRGRRRREIGIRADGGTDRRPGREGGRGHRHLPDPPPSLSWRPTSRHGHCAPCRFTVMA